MWLIASLVLDALATAFSQVTAAGAVSLMCLVVSCGIDYHSRIRDCDFGLHEDVARFSIFTRDYSHYSSLHGQDTADSLQQAPNTDICPTDPSVPGITTIT
ncbi:hypothetical protein BDZ85DRAFT_285676 [Elsinoe ampelina]|uniref:Uncharacterized protein n=1 Tax=Elsinoe ampelina TaxID=302913 RepID=A0A6A6G0G9_9PEZI|nr:hypothetical protein BDZ85DRAFT_285676 [Elsinoe ampelina]